MTLQFPKTNVDLCIIALKRSLRLFFIPQDIIYPPKSSRVLTDYKCLPETLENVNGERIVVSSKKKYEMRDAGLRTRKPSWYFPILNIRAKFIGRIFMLNELEGKKSFP